MGFLVAIKRYDLEKLGKWGPTSPLFLWSFWAPKGKKKTGEVRWPNSHAKNHGPEFRIWELMGFVASSFGRWPDGTGDNSGWSVGPEITPRGLGQNDATEPL